MIRATAGLATAIVVALIYGQATVRAQDTEGKLRDSKYHYVTCRFVGVTTTGKIKVNFRGNLRLFKVDDNTTIRDNDKKKFIKVEDLGALEAKRCIIYYNPANDTVFEMRLPIPGD